MAFQSILIVGSNVENRLKAAQKVAPEATATAPAGIDEIRQIRRLISLGKSVIIQEAHSLSVEAQNALLKTLEEPPERTQIILCAPSADLLLPTVVSRCFISDLGNLSYPEISPQEKENLEKILDWVGESNIKKGFVWAKEIPDRKTAVAEIDKLLIFSHRQKIFAPVKKLFEAKKYLLANANTRLTLENLFI